MSSPSLLLRGPLLLPFTLRLPSPLSRWSTAGISDGLRRTAVNTRFMGTCTGTKGTAGQPVRVLKAEAEAAAGSSARAHARRWAARRARTLEQPAMLRQLRQTPSMPADAHACGATVGVHASSAIPPPGA